jgi:hypothetical protein
MVERVMVYWNLNKKCFSLKSTKTGKVVAHRQQVTVFNATTKVSEAGRQRVLREKRKNVHAGIVGDVHLDCHQVILWPYLVWSRRITYNPYKGPNFVYDDLAPVTGDFTAMLTTNGEKPSIYICNK